MEELQGLIITVVGGDDRETELIRILLSKGAVVRVVGRPWRKEMTGAQLVGPLDQGLEGADVVIAPIQGVDEEGNIYAQWPWQPLKLTDEGMKRIRPGGLFFIGKARGWLRDMAARNGIKLIEIRDRDDFAIQNSIPSAEGVLQMAMEELPITIHGSESLVLGFGRTGKTLARMLYGIGAHVTVAARRIEDLDRIEEMGYRPWPIERLAEAVPNVDVIFNTIPDMVLTGPVLSKCRPDVLIIDLASDPGGTDFEAAKKLGLRAILCPSLPGKVAPKTAGRIMAKVILRLIKQELPLPK